MHTQTTPLYRPAIRGRDYYRQILIAHRPGGPTYDEAMYDLREAHAGCTSTSPWCR